MAELVPTKIATAKSNLADAGLSGYVDIREGDARVTLSDLGGPVDFVLIDGWPVSQEPSLAREVIQVVAPQIRIGGYVVNDNAEPDFLEFIRDSENGFISVEVPSCLRVRHPPLFAKGAKVGNPPRKLPPRYVNRQVSSRGEPRQL